MDRPGDRTGGGKVLVLGAGALKAPTSLTSNFSPICRHVAAQKSPGSQWYRSQAQRFKAF